MGKPQRLDIIQEIQNERGSCLISYITSTRQGLDTPMAMDCIRKIYDHLQFLTTKKEVNIDLFIHSNGGNGIVPWRLVTLIREYTNKFSVLIPHRAFSAATLTALGADEIVMHPMGMLGPTDATVINPFNPIDPFNPSQRMGISVEDVTAYIALIKDDVGIRHEDELIQAFNKLAEQVHPLALGNIKRSLSQSRMMAKKLLSLHMDLKDEHKIGEIVDSLTSKLFYHGHPINRTEAKEQIGLPTIQFPPSNIEKLIWDLYLDYEDDLKLESPFDIMSEFYTHQSNSQTEISEITPVLTTKLACIESLHRTDVSNLNYQISGHKAPQGFMQANFIPLRNEWIVE